MIKGFVLVGGLLAYVYYVSRDREMKENVVEKIVGSGSLKKNAAFCIAGGAGVLLGAEFMVSSATAIAAMFSIPETLIGLTIVAVGTSLPEIATTLTAAFKKMEGIALGNIIGSNIFNLLMVLGVSSVAGASVSDPMIINYSIPMMLLVSVMVVIFMRGQNDITRAEGTSLLLLYVIFIYLKFFVLSLIHI